MAADKKLDQMAGILLRVQALNLAVKAAVDGYELRCEPITITHLTTIADEYVAELLELIDGLSKDLKLATSQLGGAS